MKIAITLGQDMAALIAELLSSGQAALAALPPLPATSDFVSFAPEGDLFGGDLTVTIEPAPALTAWGDAIKQRLEAFVQARSQAK